MEGETLRKCVQRPTGFRNGLRAAARSTLLSTLGYFQGKRRNRCALRCFTAHYVFDDQRAEFRQRIEVLRNMGEFVSTDDVAEMMAGAVPIDGTYFHLSFDDGLECISRNAVPVLSDLRIPAIVFVNSALAGGASTEERENWEDATNYGSRVRVMDWKTLAETGLEIGAHTRTHRRLCDLRSDPVALKEEVLGCKTEIEESLTLSCRYFAWPYGRENDFDEKSMLAIRNAGFSAAFGAFRGQVNPGRTNRFFIPRHHFEPEWPDAHIRCFAHGGFE